MIIFWGVIWVCSSLISVIPQHPKLKFFYSKKILSTFILVPINIWGNSLPNFKKINNRCTNTIFFNSLAFFKASTLSRQLTIAFAMPIMIRSWQLRRSSCCKWISRKKKFEKDSVRSCTWMPRIMSVWQAVLQTNTAYWEMAVKLYK